jgi:hypothetical protein
LQQIRNKLPYVIIIIEAQPGDTFALGDHLLSLCANSGVVLPNQRQQTSRLQPALLDGLRS